jgi:hypothetical protein
MGSPAVTQSGTVMCLHGGPAQPATPLPRVKLSGASAVGQAAPYTVSGCSFPPQSGGPCATAQWTVGTTRVKSNGQPLVIQGGSATCMPTGVPLTITTVQPRVKAT